MKKNFSQFNILDHCCSNHTDVKPPLPDIRQTQMALPRLEQERLLIDLIGSGVDFLRKWMLVGLTFHNFRHGTVFSLGS
ncbi:hypothetical protein [cyanobacterium endosymbiont of Rhopalodia gibberula]|uniref:hypothetical protein n=1 Tax=cyanobacterium endosymbiont of Rhopalodia gibberula TaxID=1763363 RepID=UPI001E475E75|nr:hypothetical protein [cyanobacterium endosymbiont of Rhopalodia gibberula]